MNSRFERRRLVLPWFTSKKLAKGKSKIFSFESEGEKVTIILSSNLLGPVQISTGCTGVPKNNQQAVLEVGGNMI